MGKAYSTHERNEKFIKTSAWKPEVKEPLERPRRGLEDKGNGLRCCGLDLFDLG
jgi:hypothetical protein